MNADHLESVFANASGKRTPQERAAYLDEACAGDAALRERVEGLLKAHDAAGSFLGKPAAEGGVTSAAAAGQWIDSKFSGADAAAPAESPGTRIGPYKLLQLLGEGGMGTVWVAEQEQPVKRRVALKVIKPGMDSAQVLRRFQAEEQALALMDHANIAKVLDAGTIPSEPGRVSAGRPYFVMELVKGVPITKYCDELHLPLRERLELLVPVCQAIQHAHQKGIIHRDIKPSNVLVCVQDGKPVAKVIDFGVAKALHQNLADRTMYTEVGAIIGTLEYMSPEQAELSALDIDTRADVYALGVLLYELLTGTTPFDRKRLRESAFTEMLRIIREVEPPKPSTRLTESKESLASLAAQRKTDAAKLPKLVRGELDWIVMKCLEKDRTRRYESASGLAKDVERYLHDEPVEACPPSAGYRLRKFARRYRAALATAAAFALLLLTGIVASTWLAVRATQAERAALLAQEEESQQRQQAEEQRTRASVAEKEAQAKEQKARAQERKAGDLAVDMMGIVEVFQNQVQHVIAAYKDSGKMDQAVAFYEQALAAVKAKMGPNHPSTFVSMANLAAAYKAAGKLDQVLALSEQLIPIMMAGPGADHPTTFASMASLARTYGEAGKWDRAIELHKQILATMKDKLGPDHVVTFRGMSNLASAYWDAGQREKALPLWEEMIARQKADMGADHPGVVNNMHNLAGLYQDAGRRDKALSLYEQTLAKRLENLGPDHLDTISTSYKLAVAYADQGQHAKAEPLYLDVFARQKARLGPDHPEVANVLADLTLSHLKQKKYAEAEPLVRDCLRIRQQKLPDDWSTFNAKAMLGGSLLGQQKYADAEPLLLQGYEGMKQREAKIPPQGKGRLTEALERLVQLYDAWDKKDKADEWRKKLDEAKEVSDKNPAKK